MKLATELALLGAYLASMSLIVLAGLLTIAHAAGI